MFVETELKVDGSTVSKKRIEKGFFEDFITYHKMSDLILFCSGKSSYFLKDKVVFELNLCVPDTDDCYMFYVNIFTNGSITIEERIIDWDFL